MKLVPSDAAAVPVSQPTERTGHGGHEHGDGLEWEDLMPEINRASDPSNMIWRPTMTSCSQRRTRLVEARALPQLAGRGCRAEVGAHQFQALKSLGVPAELVIYPGQYHGISKPTYQRDRLERYVAWYDKYTKAPKTAAAGAPAADAGAH